MSKYDLLTLPPRALNDFLSRNFNERIPQDVATVDDMIFARKTMLRLTAEYSYLMELSSCAKVMVREARRTGSKEEWEDMVDRRDIIQNEVSALLQKYQALSRAVTIKQECNKELNMQLPA